MLVIRDAQMEVMRRPFQVAQAAAMERHVSAYFPEVYITLGVERLRTAIAWLQRCAAGYGLHGATDTLRLLNLACRYGWGFDCAALPAWVHDSLTDDHISAPRDRLDLLVRRCLHRETVALHDRARHDCFDHAAALAAGQRPAYVPAAALESESPVLADQAVSAWLSRQLRPLPPDMFDDVGEPSCA